MDDAVSAQEMKMEQILHMDLMYAWAPVWVCGEEGFVRTKMFLRLGGY